MDGISSRGLRRLIAAKGSFAEAVRGSSAVWCLAAAPLPVQSRERCVDWLITGILPDVNEDGVDAFVDEVIPLLQERVIYPIDYEGPPCVTTWESRPSTATTRRVTGSDL